MLSIQNCTFGMRKAIKFTTSTFWTHWTIKMNMICRHNIIWGTYNWVPIKDNSEYLQNCFCSSDIHYNTEVMLRQPRNFEWDDTDSRFFVCEGTLLSVNVLRQDSGPINSQNSVNCWSCFPPFKRIFFQAELIIASFFVNTEYGILLNDQFAVQDGFQSLIGVSVPSIYVTRAVGFHCNI